MKRKYPILTYVAAYEWLAKKIKNVFTNNIKNISF